MIHYAVTLRARYFCLDTKNCYQPFRLGDFVLKFSHQIGKTVISGSKLYFICDSMLTISTILCETGAIGARIYYIFNCSVFFGLPSTEHNFYFYFILILILIFILIFCFKHCIDPVPKPTDFSHKKTLTQSSHASGTRALTSSSPAVHEEGVSVAMDMTVKCVRACLCAVGVSSLSRYPAVILSPSGFFLYIPVMYKKVIIIDT